MEEETGLKGVELNNFIGKTTHFYKEKGKDIEKETHWYAMRAKGKQQLVPQLEEDITELKWVKENEVTHYYSNTFDNIIEIIDKYYAK